MKCPRCENEISTNTTCAFCNYVPLVEDLSCVGLAFDQQPKTHKFNIGDKISINNKDYPLHNRVGIIINKDFFNYRVKITKKKTLWVPFDWVNLHT